MLRAIFRYLRDAFSVHPYSPMVLDHDNYETFFNGVSYDTQQTFPRVKRGIVP